MFINRTNKTNLFFLHIFFLLCTGSLTSLAQLKADFTVDKTGGCAPLTVSFTNKTTGASANAIYKWNFGNGNTATTTNPGAIFINEQSYVVTLTVQDGTQTSVKTQAVTVYKKPIADFTTSAIKQCLSSPVTFTSSAEPGDGTIASYYWDFGDGITQQGFSNNQAHSYSMVQKATVSLTVTNNYGCYSTIQKKDIVELIPALIAGFSADKRMLCKETDAVQFTNSSNGPGTLSYAWDFGDGATAAATNPAHAYNKKGIYTVKLTVNSSEGCTVSSVQPGYINVANYSAAFDVPVPICERSGATFTGKSTPAPNTSVWQVNGTTAGYSNTLFYTFNTAGTYTIKLFNTFGACADSMEKQVTVNKIPDLRGFIIDLKDSCGAPVTVNFRDTTSTAVKWDWNFMYPLTSPRSTVQAPSYTYTNDGSYTVQLKVITAAGCSTSIQQYFKTIKPDVSIWPESPIYSGCKTLTTSFKASATEPIVSYNWNFGDGSTYTDAEPVHTYTTPGNYQVKLTYTTKNGCTGTAYFNGINVYRQPAIDFTASRTQVCAYSLVEFNATLTPNQGYTDLRLFWDFGDGVSYYDDNSVLHSYTRPGTYTVKVTVYNGNCTDTVTKTNYITVLAAPDPIYLRGANTCNGTRGEVIFTANPGNATSITWNFDDGTPPVTTPATQTSISHVYTKTGSYNATISTSLGTCAASSGATVLILLKQKPLLTTDKAVMCIGDGLPVKIANYDYNPPGNPSSPHYSLQFQYDDGSLYAGAMNTTNPYWTNVYEGTVLNPEKEKQKIRVITTSVYFGCRDTTNYITYQLKGAAAGLQVVTNNVCYKNAVELKDTSKTYNNTIQSWLWNFGDGQTSTQNGGTVSHAYNNPGAYNATLKITDAAGCTSVATAGVTVNALGPKADFTASATNVNINTAVYFYNTTNNYGVNNTTYQWYMNDVPFSSANSPSYTFDQPGAYTIKLVASSATSQCSSETTRQIVVNNLNAAFNFTPSFITAGNCPPVLVRFINTSVNFTSIKWDFGDGFTLENVNYPGHIYEKPGKYIITLYVYAGGLLKGTHIDSLFIKQPQADVQTSSTEGCIGHMVTLNATIKNTASYLWDFGDGSMLQTADSFATHQYMSPGVYSPALLMKETTNGCAAATTLAGKIDIHENPAVTITPVDPVICLGAYANLQAGGGTVYEWTPATGLSNANIASPVATPVETTLYTVKVADAIGCESTGLVKVTVVQPVTVHVMPDTSVCKGDVVQLQTSGAELYNWINNTTGLSNTQIANPVAQPPGTTQYTVTGSDKYLCFSDTASITITTLPLPSVQAGANVEAWAGDPVPLHATGSNDVVTWKWTPKLYLNCSNCPNPVSTPHASVIYTITVKNQYGCKATDSIAIKTLCEESHVSIPNGFTPNGDGVNDVFIIKGISIVKHLIIYNRWGQKVYERSHFIAGDRSLCWDGKLNGYPAEEGTYVYFAEMECPAGQQFIRKGTVTLLR